MLAVMVQPELVHAGLPRKLFLVKDDGAGVRRTPDRGFDRRITVPLLVVERNPFANGRDLGNLLRLTRSETVDSDPVLAGMTGRRVPGDAYGLSDVESNGLVGAGGRGRDRDMVARPVDRANVIGRTTDKSGDRSAYGFLSDHVYRRSRNDHLLPRLLDELLGIMYHLVQSRSSCDEAQ
jgi:hypothetical protein